MKIYLSSFALCALAACGGSSTTDAFGAAQNASEPLFDAVEPADPVDPRNVQATGSARFDGAMILFVRDDLSALGDFDMRADFATDSFSGTAQNFVDSNSETYAGTLDMTDGIINRDVDFSADYSLTALLDGTLTGETQNITVDGFVVGDIAGDAEQYFKGFLRVGFNGDTYEDGDEFGGIVVAER